MAKLSIVALSFALLSSRTIAAPVPQLPDFLRDAAGAVINPVKSFLGVDAKDNTVAPTLMSQAEVDGFTTFVQFARASFCSAPVTLAWQCGEACDANPETQVLLAGGDDGLIPGFYVAYDPPTNSMVVAHQGTNRNNPLSIINDVDIIQDEPSDEFLPGAAAAGVKIHGGFLDTFERTATQVLETVQQGIAEKGATNVRIVGHSLGAAVSLLDTLHLRSKLDPSITMETVLFGLPRVGNPEFANFVDATVANDSFQFFINDVDPVPRVPPVELGFRHPSGEIFQRNGTTLETFRCPGQENENCSTGVSLLDADASAHKGPYAGVFVGSKFCTL